MVWKFLLGIGLTVAGLLLYRMMDKKKGGANAEAGPRVKPMSGRSTTAPPLRSGEASSSWTAGFSLDPEGGRAAWLVVTAGPDKGKTFRLGQRLMTVGRAASNFVQLNDPEVSRIHCQFRPLPNGYEVLDMKSAQGVTVAGKQVAAGRLEDGTEIRLGGTTLRFEADGSYAMDYALGRKEIGDAHAAETMAAGSLMQAAGLAGEGGLEKILDLGRRARDGSDKGALLDEVGDLAMAQLEADRMLLMWQREGSWSLVRHRFRQGLPPEAGRAQPDKPLMLGAARSGRAVHVDYAAGGAESGSVQKAVAVPVQRDGNTLGVLYVDRVIAGGEAFTERQVQYLQLLSDQMPRMMQG
jgi:hypothetical protein